MSCSQTPVIPVGRFAWAGGWVVLGLLTLAGCTAEEAPQTTFQARFDPTPEQIEDAAITESRIIFNEAVATYYNGDLTRTNELFDAVIERVPEQVSQLWQRGIVKYQLGDYDAGRYQFERCYEVNPTSVENAAWQMLCIARMPGETIETASKKMIGLDLSTSRATPMAEIYRLYRGEGNLQEVLDAADDRRADLYANLYVGLYLEAGGDREAAQKYLKRAAEIPVPGHEYICAVAQNHWRQVFNRSDSAATETVADSDQMSDKLPADEKTSDERTNDNATENSTGNSTENSPATSTADGSN